MSTGRGGVALCSRKRQGVQERNQKDTQGHVIWGPPHGQRPHGNGEVQADRLRLGQLVLLMAGLWTFRTSHGLCVLIWLLGGVFNALHSLIYSSTDQSRGHKPWPN